MDPALWSRHDLQPLAKRLKALEARLAQEPDHVLSEAQVRAMEKAKQERKRMARSRRLVPAVWARRIRLTSERIKGIGRIYQQTFIDTYTKVAFEKLYDRKDALVAADLLNDRVVLFFEEQEVSLLRILTYRGTEYCGQREHHEYQLYLAVENIDHPRTKTKPRRAMESVNDSTKPCRTSSTAWPP